MTYLVLSGCLAFCAGVILTGVVRYAALRRGVMDVPNARSSHSVPTPRGGGLSFVAITLAFSAVAGVAGWIRQDLALALGFGGGLIAAIGIADDVWTLGTRLRLMVHAASAVLVMVLLGPVATLPYPGGELAFGPFAWIITFLFAIWLVNLTNFMDGINGISGVHALAFCLVTLILALSAEDHSTATASVVLGAAVGGFLVWNFPVGKIFMGDAGSGFLGMAALILMLARGWSASEGSAVLILLAPFITDATLTLVLRLAEGEAVMQAHRRHLYQRLSRIWGSHVKVTLCFAAVELLVMLPLALWASGFFGHPASGTALLLAYALCAGTWLLTLRPTQRKDPAR